MSVLLVPKCTSITLNRFKFGLFRRSGQVLSFKLLDSEFSDPALRAFLIPFISERFVRHGLLELYKRVEADEDRPGEIG